MHFFRVLGSPTTARKPDSYGLTSNKTKEQILGPKEFSANSLKILPEFHSEVSGKAQQTKTNP